jgi:hypothetical protein
MRSFLRQTGIWGRGRSSKIQPLREPRSKPLPIAGLQGVQGIKRMIFGFSNFGACFIPAAFSAVEILISTHRNQWVFPGTFPTSPQIFFDRHYPASDSNLPCSARWR